MSEIKWIKIVTGIFDNDKIKIIESMPDADTIIVIWFKLLCLAGKKNYSGLLMFTENIPYSDEMLAQVFRRPLNTVRLAIQTFINYGMVEIIDGTIAVSNWEKYQSEEKLNKIREQGRLRQQHYRERQKKIANKEQRNALPDATETSQNAKDNKDKDLDLDTTTPTPPSGCCSVDDQDYVISEAENSGFPNNKSTQRIIRDLCEQYGKSVILSGINACVEHGKTTIAYLRGCCENMLDNQKAPRQNPLLPGDHSFMGWGD